MATTTPVTVGVAWTEISATVAALSVMNTGGLPVILAASALAPAAGSGGALATRTPVTINVTTGLKLWGRVYSADSDAISVVVVL
jgi:hypothetical protein